MFQVPQANVNEWKQLFNNHRALISGCDVYFQNMVMLNGRHKIMDRATFLEEYRGFTDDIECETQPIDAFEPYVAPEEPEEADEAAGETSSETEEKKPLFTCNREAKEYVRIKNRVTMDQLKRTFNETHPIMMALAEGKVTYDDIIDDIYIYYCFFKYSRQIETIRIAAFSNYTPIIEYIVNNVTYDDLKKFMEKDTIDEEKVDKHTDTIFFSYDRKAVVDFYLNPDNGDYTPTFDLDRLINVLISNIVLKSDIYMILGVYLTASFAMSDFKFAKTPAQIEGSPCAMYVREVLAAL